MSFDPQHVYSASDGALTKRFYAELETRGFIGRVAVALFRAHKCSSRAKVYRGGIRGKGSFKSMAYDRKAWSLAQLCELLERENPMGIVWGWKRDPMGGPHAWVLYVEIPTGQVSFHSPDRGKGPDYQGEWDGLRGAGEGRVVEFCRSVLSTSPQQQLEISA